MLDLKGNKITYQMLPQNGWDYHAQRPVRAH